MNTPTAAKASTLENKFIVGRTYEFEYFFFYKVEFEQPPLNIYSCVLQCESYNRIEARQQIK